MAQAETIKTGTPVKRKRNWWFALPVAGIIIVFIIVAIPYYQNYIAPFNRTVISVDNQKVSMGYFMGRIKITGWDPITALQNITEQEVVKLAAPRYGIKVTDAEVENELRARATGSNPEISDIEFKEWYRQRLNDLDVTDSQYKSLIYDYLISDRLNNYLAARAPDREPQIHLHEIVTLSHDDAIEIQTRLRGGENFVLLSQELSNSNSSKGRGKDIGWVPVSLLPFFQSQIAALNTGEFAGPLPLEDHDSNSSNAGAPEAFYFFLVSEKDPDRLLNADQLKTVRQQALARWLPGEIEKHDVKYDFNSDTVNWIYKQLGNTGSKATQPVRPSGN